MKNTIYIKRSELQQQIDLRNYYMGESAKRKDNDATTIQSSKDDDELLCMFITRACNELVTAVALRFPLISAIVGNKEIEITFETESGYPEHLLPMLEHSIFNYLVNEAIMQWLLVRRPDMAQSYISLRATLYSNVQHLFAKIYSRKKIRRRATDLAGI
ncbi:MAG: hypothetical protein IKV07_07695 [Bacteroidaceae bacterium]|nr:hypothetical protein [Bacteroidaceae bacterium]